MDLIITILPAVVTIGSSHLSPVYKLLIMGVL